MQKLIQFFNRPITSERADNSFVLWACSASAVAQLILATVFFVRHARDGMELLCGLGLSLATFAALIATGVSVTWLERAMRQHRLPGRRRLGEFASYAAAIGTMLAGVTYLATLPLERPEMTMGLLVILTAAMVVICVGAWSTLWQVGRRRQA